MESEIRESKTIKVGNKDSVKIVDGIDRVIKNLEEMQDILENYKYSFGGLAITGYGEMAVLHYKMILRKCRRSLDILKKGKGR